MRAAYLTAPGRFELRSVPDPELQSPTDVRLALSAVGVCGSDLHYYRTGRIGNQVLSSPWIMGHECTAVVESVARASVGCSPAIASRSIR